VPFYIEIMGNESTKSWSWHWGASIRCVSTNCRDEMAQGRSSPRRMRYEANQAKSANSQLVHSDGA